MLTCHPVTSRPVSLACRKKQFDLLVTSRPPIWQVAFWICISLKIEDPFATPQSFVECFIGRHRGGRNFTSFSRFSGPSLRAAKWAFSSTLKLATPWNDHPFNNSHSEFLSPLNFATPRNRGPLRNTPTKQFLADLPFSKSERSKQ